MRVACDVEECLVKNYEGREVPGVCATCSRCDHGATAYGTGPRSITRALMTLKQECPNDESNFYVADDGGGESRMPDPVVTPWWEKRK